MKEDIVNKVKLLIEAKENVLFCLNHPKGLVNMHGLSYWAGEVERLRKELDDKL